MKTLFLIFAITAVLLLICLALIGIKILIKKNGQFKRSCSSVDPYTGKRTNCICGNDNVFTTCEEDLKHYEPLQVNKELLQEVGQKNTENK